MANLTTAQPLDRGAHQLQFSAGTWAIDGIPIEDGHSMRVLPAVHIQYRLGLGGNADLGITLNTLTTTQLDFKAAIVRTRRFVMALDPTLGFAFVTDRTEPFVVFNYAVPLLMDVAFDGVTVTLGPKWHGVAGFGDESHLGMVGSTLAVRAQFTDTLSVIPHAGIAFPVLGDLGGVPLLFEAGVAIGLDFPPSPR